MIREVRDQMNARIGFAEESWLEPLYPDWMDAHTYNRLVDYVDAHQKKEYFFKQMHRRNHILFKTADSGNLLTISEDIG